MAGAPADPGETDLKQRILRVLRDAGCPMKTALLVKECQVPKNKLNQVLYRMKDESQVALAGPGTWCLGNGGTGEAVSTALAQPSRAERPQQDVVTIPERPDCQLSEQQEKIYRFLEASGPCRALNIAKSLGMMTAREVNPDLYAMSKKHLLDFNQNSKVWAIYRPEGSGGRNQSTAVIYQQNPINMIYQNGPGSHISIANSQAIQIGHGNLILSQTASGENGPTVPLYPPPLESADPSTQDPLARSWGSQDIYMEKSEFRRVQLGHGNELSIHSTPTKGPACSPAGKTTASATTAGSEASFEIRMPTPRPHTEGDTGNVVQKVHISSCLLEDAAIGNSNRMRVSLGAAGPGGGAGPEDSDGDPGEPAEDAAPHSEAAQPSDNFPDNVSHTDVDISTLTFHLEAVTLESRDPEAAEDCP
ncbi:PREDICTED: Z-DNA-binding protein 1 isoform X2 [Hipposideros armiger]|uniref:Z-DNA-binding protein 1 isoform X2 n=1 Tax=Hipposideros armiger TaxID=186990 RepID=A0A8B7QV41_HIPAR|nr:PREDICTED: Z-DNA-binding protein 1 isoform X2 [Hipposideros armiger]